MVVSLFPVLKVQDGCKQYLTDTVDPVAESIVAEYAANMKSPKVSVLCNESVFGKKL